MAFCSQPWRGHRQSQLSAEHVLADMAVCWEVAAFAGSLRVLASLSREVRDVAQQLKASFHTPFLHILANTAGGHRHSAGVRWQLGTETWETLPPLGFDQRGVLSGNVEVLTLNGHLYVLAENIKHGVKGCNLQMFDPASWDWTLSCRLPSFEYEALLELGARLYILGRSLDKDGSVPQLLCHSPSTDHGLSHELEVLPAMSTTRCYVGAATLGGCIYVVGGCSAELPADGPVESLGVVERFDPGFGSGINGTWETLAPLKCPRFLCKTLEVKGCLYVLNGLNTEGVETAMERFDPTTGRWSLLAPMSMTKGTIDVAECAGRILVFGGADAAVERYDPRVNRWIKLPNIGNGKTTPDSSALVGPPADLLAVSSESSINETNLIIQRYDERRTRQDASEVASDWRVPAQRGRVRVVHALSTE